MRMNQQIKKAEEEISKKFKLDIEFVENPPPFTLLWCLEATEEDSAHEERIKQTIRQIIAYAMQYQNQNDNEGWDKGLPGYDRYYIQVVEALIPCKIKSLYSGD